MKLLEEVEQDVIKRAPLRQEWAEALLICERGGLADRRVRSFLDKCLEKMVTTCVEQPAGRQSRLLEDTLELASAQIGAALEADFSPWAARSLVSLQL